MPGKVFISCGQTLARERCIAKKIKKLLERKFKLTPYVAFEVHSLNDVLAVTEELKSSDYYLFVDFLRPVDNNEEDLPLSLFTHQELALAHHVKFKGEMIALRERGLKPHGLLCYIQGRGKTFAGEKDLLTKIESMVRERGWSKDFSRNLFVKDIITPEKPVHYQDHTGGSEEYIWQIQIDNCRPDVAAVNAVCILDYIEFPLGTIMKSADRSYLKWAGQKEYQKTILPKDFGRIDIFAIRPNDGVYLHSSSDTVPRKPIINRYGKHKLCYKVFSEGFPLCQFVVQLDYKKNTRLEARLVKKQMRNMGYNDLLRP